MADPNWRRPPSSSGGGVPFGAPKVQQQHQEGVPTNGQHGGRGSHFPAPNQPKFHSSTGIASRAPHAPQGGTFAPPSQASLANVGAPSSISSARGGERPPYAAGASNGATGFAPPPRQPSSFSASGAGMSSPPVTAPPARYGSGPPVGGAAPASTGSAMLGGGAPPPLPPPMSSSGPPSLSRGYSPAPPASTQNAFSKPLMSAPPAGPPLTWSGNGAGTAAAAANAAGGNGHAHYQAPPAFPPPQGPPSSSNGVGAATNGGHAYGNGAAPQSAPMYGARASAAPMMAAPGQYNTGYTNGGIPPPADSTRPKIRPEQIPRPIVGSEEVVYRTCTPPSVMLPPPPTSNYVAIDEGNCSPRFIRSTMAHLPITADAMGACKIPMAVVIQPMAIVGPNELPVNVVDFGESGPLRCGSCRAYINSFAKYVHNGEKWVCNFCKHEGDVPQSYRCPLDAAGLRRDREQRAELCRGSVDFVVPKAVYSLRPEQQPIFVFCVDVSPRALETGFTAACLSAIEASLDSVPGDERARVGLMTFDRSLHVYRFDEEGSVSQMVVAADTEEPFAPLPPAQWIMPLHSCRAGLPRLFESIPGLVTGNERQMSPAAACASGAALRATADCLEGIGGRIFLMAQSPADTGAGKVSRGREDAGMYGGEKEFRMYQAAGDAGKDVAAVASSVFYKALGKDCATRQVCVDLMLWSSQEVREYYDVGTIGTVPRATGGRVTYLRGGEAGGAETASHLREQLRGALRDHARSASESVLKVRCTAGMACTQRLGPGVENMPGELEVATITPQHAIVCRLEHDGRKMQEGEMIYIQSALLYTSTSGQRRVRCHTLGIPVTGAVETLFRSADVETVSAVMARQAISQALNNSVAVDVVRKQVEESMLAMLFSYRKKCASNSSAGQLILPEALRLLPLYTLCAHKMLALRPNSQGSAPDVRADERAARLLCAHTMPVVDMVQLLYPSLYSVHDLPPEFGDAPPAAPPPPATDALEGGLAERGVEGVWGRPLVGVEVPVPLPPTSEKLTSDGVFLLDCGEELVLYVGRSVGGEVMSELFGVDGVGGGPGNSGYGAVGVRLELVEDEGYELARRLRNVIGQLRRGCAGHKPLVVVVANSSVADEARFASLMAEDKTKQGTSYVDELCNLHHKIQSKMR